MQETSSLYKSIFSGIHRFEVKVNIAGTDYGMNVITSMRTNTAAFGDDGPNLGLAVASSISLDLYAYTGDVPRMAQIKPYYRVINDSRQSEWIQKGVYYVDTREYEPISGLLHLTGFDPMLKADALYPGSTLQWPATDIAVVQEIAGFIGVTIDSRTTGIMTSGYPVQLAPQMTMREMLQYIAAMYGGSFIFTETGTLRLVCAWKTGDNDPLEVINKGISQLVNPEFPACTGVRFIVSQSATEQTEVFSGDETGYVFEIECPFATQAIADSLLSKMRGMVYRPYNCEKLAADPAAEIGDAVYLGDGEKTGSRNLVQYPLGSNKVTDGITFTYETDGSVSLSGTPTKPASSSHYSITITNFSPPAGTKRIAVLVETPDSFPSKTENGYEYSFDAATHRASSTSRTLIRLQNVSTGSGKKSFYNTFATDEDITQIDIEFNHSGAGSITYNGNVKIMVVAGTETAAWEAPNGSVVPQISGIYSFDLNFNSACRPTLTAPGELEIDHEYSHESAVDRMFKRQRREAQAQITLLDDKITLVVEKIEYTVTESDNLIAFPLKPDTPQSFTESGVTFTFRDDGSVLVEGTYTGTTKSVYFTGENTGTSGTRYIMSVKTTTDFPNISSSLFNIRYYSGGYYYTLSLSQSKTEGDAKTYYAYLNGLNKLSFSVKLTNGSTYNHVLYPKIEAEPTASVPRAWEPPVGAKGSSIDNKVDKGTVSSQISLEPGQITIQGNRIAINSTNFQVTNDGTITANAGHIGGWDILPTKLEKKDTSHNGITLDPTNRFIDLHSPDNGVFIDEDEVRWYSATDGEENYTVAKMAAHLFSGGQLADLEMTMYNQCGFTIKDDGGDQYISISSGYQTVTINQECAFQNGIFMSGDTQADLYHVIVHGNLDTWGSKNRVVETKHYGKRRIGAYETACPYFGDIGQAVVDEHGECVVPIEEIFSEMVDLDTEYQVFLQKEGPGDIWVDEKAKDHFTVKGTPSLEFAWELKAKQIDHDGKRLEEYEERKRPEANE